MESRSS
ncbi:hypothetical protein EYF80_067284 [Liparis tanakae]|nr:hypothetical protein EYF80_067284 [Liparis tanakae]